MTNTFHRSLARCGSIAALACGFMIAAPSQATEVGVSISVQQPGFYGRVDIGDQRPVLVYPQPVIIHPGPYSQHQRPIYMRVPPGHYKQWARYCSQYEACNQPVYFLNGDERAWSPHQTPEKHRKDQRTKHRHGDHHGHGHH